MLDTLSSICGVVFSLANVPACPLRWPGLLVARDGAARWALGAPAHSVVHDRAQVSHVRAHPGLALRHRGDAPKDPHLAGEPVRARTLAERLGSTRTYESILSAKTFSLLLRSSCWTAVL
jgi:hypothetical protein